MATKQRSLIDFYDQESPYVTEFRRLLHRITAFDPGRELKTLMLTSAVLSEGKSTVCSLLAITAALHKGMKTLIIDADLRRPSLNRSFQVPVEPGLTDVLLEGYDPKEAVQKTSIDKLDIMTVGQYCESPSEVFDAEAIGSLIDDLKFYYDLVLVDSPPLVPVSDPMLLASKVDGILLIVKAGETQKEVVERALSILDSQRDNVLGVVLNNMNHTLPFYYDYEYYNYERIRKPSKSKKSSSQRTRRDLKGKRAFDKGKSFRPSRVE